MRDAPVMVIKTNTPGSYGDVTGKSPVFPYHVIIDIDLIVSTRYTRFRLPVPFQPDTFDNNRRYSIIMITIPAMSIAAQKWVCMPRYLYSSLFARFGLWRYLVRRGLFCRR